MPYTEAIAEAFASAPVDRVIYDTIELYHPAFRDEFGAPTAIRLVLGYENITARLESSAIINANEYVEFLAMEFSFTLPEFSEDGNPTTQLQVANASREITRNLELAKQALVPIKMTYRPYLNSDLSIPQMNPPIVMELAEVDVDAFSASGSCTVEDIHNRRFPDDIYTTDRFPGLRR